MEQKFKKWLPRQTNKMGNIFQKGEAEEFAKYLSQPLPNGIVTSVSIFKILDIDKIEEIKNSLTKEKNNPELFAFNKKKSNGRPSQALYQYKKFLNFLATRNIWKMSHGGQTEDQKDLLFKNNQISLHKNTKALAQQKKSQAGFFREDVKIGDIVMLCHGNNIKRLVTVTSEITNPDDEWICRKYEILKELDGEKKYTGEQKWWTSNNRSTFTQVKESDYCSFENLVLKPFFDKNLKDIGFNIDCEKSIEENNMDDKSQNKNEVLHMENQILYGPPGTGKTFSTVGKALEILEKTATDEQKQKIKEIKNKNIKSIRQLKEVFESQVEFVTFHQSFSYEDFVEGLKANSDGNNITYDIESGIFKLICENAKNSGNDSLEKLNEAIEKLKEQVEEVPLKLETLAHQKPYILTYKGNKAFYAKPDAGKYSNPVSIDSIVKLYKNPEVKSGDDGVHFKIYTLPVIEYLKENFKLLDYQEKTDKKPHVLIIDEINRGNISRIFGELITLIEPSKRAGNDETISVQLPYSKKPFSVPKNLYIIGTMNTADRSLALMDTALRRRFDFTEMMPNPKLVTGKFDGIDLQKILESINERIEILYDREHTIGHSFLMNINTLPELRNAFKNKILPLLEEYFYDDFKKIRLVLNDTDKFYKKKEVKLGEFEKTIYRKQTIDSLEADAFTRIYEPIPNEE